MFSWLKNFFQFERTKYVHRLADEREALYDKLRGRDTSGRYKLLEEISETNPELYQSWILEPYPGPGPGDHDYRGI